MPEISVILPAYNVADYLPRALDSLLGQTFRDFEALVVDDGSADRTGEICDEYARRDPRVRAIHQKNAGAPAARNAAIQISRGKYLYFMDGDDWAEPDMLEKMHALAAKTGAQLVVTGFYIDTYYTGEKFWRQTQACPAAFYATAQEFRQASVPIFDKNLLYVPWNKLFDGQRVREGGFRFRNTKMDDYPFVLDYIRDVETVAVSGEAFYHFTRARAESETARYFPGLFEKREEEHAWMLDLFRHWGMENQPQAVEFLARRYVERIFGVVENFTCRACPLSTREKRRRIGEILRCPNLEWGLKYMRPGSLVMRLMLIPLKMRSAGLTYALGKCMSFVKKNAMLLFARLKADR